jgi:pimeloyl-ACP methyl ester carboxylesterase
MEVTTIGIDLAKSVFAVCGADSSGRVVMRRQLRRPQVLSFMRGLPRCVVGMEASGGAHYWARQLTALGLLAIWGKNDPFFIPPGAEAYRRDIPDAEVRLLDTGHFALEMHAEEIGRAIREFLGMRLRPELLRGLKR